jgi:7,8-dihydroneopterin aldolase/epimerase/oxygenase
VDDVTRERDSITLTGLRIAANHGVFDFEREQGQDFIVDVTAYLDLGTAAGSDDLGATLDYGTLATEVTTAVQRDPVDLIETLAERVASVVLGHRVVDEVRVTVHKPDAPIQVPFGDVAVTLTRWRT